MRCSEIDLHMHTRVSDGTDAPEELPAKVKAAGIRLFSVTDHDDVRSGELIPPLLRAGDPAFVTGVEFSCRDEGGKYHVLGYGFDPKAPGPRETAEHGHELRMRKLTARLDFLKTEFGIAFPQEELDRLRALDNPGKPHLGNLLVKYGHAKTKDAAIRQYLDKLRFREEYLRPEEAIRGVLAGGGIPVLAHPAYGDGDQLSLGEELDARVRRLTDFGLQGLEGFYSGFSTKICLEVLSLAARYDLYVTAGSDYHGGNKLVTLGDTGLDPELDYPAGLLRFLRDVRCCGSFAV